jgi:uncharacterized protein YoxC
MSDLGGQPAQIASLERERFQQFKSAADLICTEECRESTAAHWLKGYRAYAVEQWLLSDRQAYWVVAERTSRDEDAICVGTFFQSLDSSAAQVQAWHDVFVTASTSDADGVVIPRDTTHGVLLTVASARQLEDLGLTLVPLPGGDFEAVKADLLYRLSLKRLSCAPPRLPISLAATDLRSAEAAFLAQYRVGHSDDAAPLTADMRHVVEQLIVAVRTQLRTLGHRVRSAAAVEAFVDESLMTAISAFQSTYNRALEQQMTLPDAPMVRLLECSGKLDLFTLDALCHQSAEFRNWLADRGYRTTPAPAIVADPEAGNVAARRLDRASHFIDKKMTRVLDAPRVISRHISNSLRDNVPFKHSSDSTPAPPADVSGSSPPNESAISSPQTMLEKLRSKGSRALGRADGPSAVMRGQSARVPLRATNTIDATSPTNVFDRRAERNKALRESLRSSDDSALQLSTDRSVAPTPTERSQLATPIDRSYAPTPSDHRSQAPTPFDRSHAATPTQTLSLPIVTLPDEPQQQQQQQQRPAPERRRRRSSSVSTVPSPRSSLESDVATQCHKRLDTLGMFDEIGALVPAPLRESAAPSVFHIPDEVRERVGIVEWRDAADAALSDERVTFACADQRLCEWAVSMQLATMERWEPSALVGYQLFVVNTLTVQDEPCARTVLQQTVSRRHRVAAGIMRAKPHLSQMQRQQVIALFFRPALPQMPSLCVVREASLIGFVSNVYVPSVAEQFAAERGTPTHDIVAAFKEWNVQVTLNAGDDLPQLVRELALLVSLQRLGCASGAALDGASLTERLRGARRLLHADFGPWLRSTSSASGANTYLADAVADDIGAVVVPLRNALRLLLALPPAPGSGGDVQFESQFVDSALLNAARLHAERCELGGSEGIITPAFVESVSEQLTALKYEFASAGIDAPRDPFINYDAMTVAANEYRARKDYVAAVRKVIVSLVVQRDVSHSMRQSPGRQPAEMIAAAAAAATVEIKAPPPALSPPLSPPAMLSPPHQPEEVKMSRSAGGRRVSIPTAARVIAPEVEESGEDEPHRRQSLARHIAVRRDLVAQAPEDMVSELRLQNAQLLSQRNDELTQATLLWQERFVQMQRDVKSLEQELQRMQDTNATLESDVEATRATNATLRRQLYATLEMINGHGERVQSYAMKVAVLEQTVENVERAHTRGFVQQFFWTVLTTTLSIITLSIAAVSGAVHIVSAKLRGRPVDSRATLAKAISIAQQATVDAIEGTENGGTHGTTDSGDLTLSDSALSALHKSVSTPPGRIVDMPARLQAGGVNTTIAAAAAATSAVQSPARTVDYTARVGAPLTSAATVRSPARSPATKYFAAHPTTVDSVRDDAASLLPPPINAHPASDDLRRRRPKSNSTSKPKLSDFIDDIEFGD